MSAPKQSDLFENTVISTRVRLARNISGKLFPDRIAASDARDIIKKVGSALSKLDHFTEYDIGALGCDEAIVLQEKNLISPDLIRRKDISAAFISSDREVSVMVNEEDHLREQYILKGYDLYKAYERLSGIDDGLEETLDFAFDDKLGYISACPSNLGTGMRASVMMFLPALARYEKLKGLLPSLKSNGLTVRGGFGEGTAAEGYSYQISNEKTLGFSETDILSHMNEVSLSLAELEMRFREKMLSENRLELLDSSLRAYGALNNCAKLSYTELSEKIVQVRLGVALGFFTTPDKDAFGDFLANMRPTSFKVGNCPAATVEEQDICRAKIVGNVLPRLVKRAAEKGA